MKKIILLILLLAGIYPSIEHGHLLITASQTAYAQSNMDGVEICATYTEDIQYHYDGPETTVTTTVCLVKIDCNTLDEIGEREDCQETIVVNGPCENYGPDARYDPECGCIGPGTTMEECPPLDCYGESGGTAYDSDCGCVGGSTGIPDCPEEPPIPDCHGTPNGTAKEDACGTCVGGKTGKTAKKWYYDSDGDGWGGTTTKTCYEGGSGWVNKGGDKNDNCPNATNDPVQCTTCDTTYALYNPAVCNCPCLKNLPVSATGGLLRNYNGDIIKQEGNWFADDQPYAEGRLSTLDYRIDSVLTADGTRWPVYSVIGGLDTAGNPLDAQTIHNLSYNCIGSALADEEYVVNAGNTDFVNALLGISSISGAITNSTFRYDFANIQSGQILIVLNGSANGYVHAATYIGNGNYLTKNGQGNGDQGTETMTLGGIQGIYGGIYMFTNAPPKTSLTSNLGKDTDGKTNKAAIDNALKNCGCNH